MDCFEHGCLWNCFPIVEVRMCVRAHARWPMSRVLFCFLCSGRSLLILRSVDSVPAFAHPTSICMYMISLPLNRPGGIFSLDCSLRQLFNNFASRRPCFHVHNLSSRTQHICPPLLAQETFLGSTSAHGQSYSHADATTRDRSSTGLTDLTRIERRSHRFDVGTRGTLRERG